MFDIRLSKRGLIGLVGLSLLAGCKMVPKAPSDLPPPPDSSTLPADAQRHRIALLVPLSGPGGPAGQAIANAATMAILDTSAQNLRLTTYDTSAGAAPAAARAVADGNRLILGPLLESDIPAIAATAKASRLPVITFASNVPATRGEVHVMGLQTGQSIARTVAYARLQGANRFAALVPNGEYGQRASNALTASVRSAGGTITAMESFDRTNTSIVSAARRLKARGGYDAVLIADSGRLAALAAPVLRPTRFLGTELWSLDGAVAQSPALNGALFSSVSDARFAQFSASYRNRFGTSPGRVATLGYDAVLLTLRIARDWKTGTPFPVASLMDRDGFLGLDGPFRFSTNGVVERAMEVREVRGGAVRVASPAPQRFVD